jgi:Sulfotransferase family
MRPVQGPAMPADPQPGPEGRRGLLVLGLPRAGATWVGETLGVAPGTRLVNEPDNETSNPFAARAKLPLGRYPVLDADEQAPQDYRTLWARAFSGADNRRGPRTRLAEVLLRRVDATERWNAFCATRPDGASMRLRAISALAVAPPPGHAAQAVVKSAHAAFAARWIAARFRPRVVVVLRHPFNVVASWTELGWGGCGLDSNPKIVERYVRKWDLPALPPSCSRLTRVSWEVGLQLSALRWAAEEEPDWVVVQHEDLCSDPAERFRALYAVLGLDWTDAAQVHLRQANRPAQGLVTMRVASEQPERWRTRLSGDQVREIARTLELFPAVAGSL